MDCSYWNKYFLKSVSEDICFSGNGAINQPSLYYYGYGFTLYNKFISNEILVILPINTIIHGKVKGRKRAEQCKSINFRYYFNN